MKKYALFFFLVIFLFAGSASGFDLKGIQPLSPYGIFSTFSTESLKKGKTDIVFGIERSQHPDFYRFTNQVGYGISDSLELDVTLPYITGWEHSTDGFEDIAIGVKHRLFDEGYYWPSLAYIISVSLHSGNAEFTTEGSIGGGIIITKRVGPVKAHVNLLYFRPGTSKLRDDITFAAGLDFAAAHSFHILGELYGKKSYAGKVDRLEARFGYRFLTTEDLFTTIGAGFDLKNRTPEFRLLLSVSYIFPREEKKIKKVIEEEE
jgi:hypothetical protein